MQERVLADKVTNMLMIQILIKKTTHYQFKMLHAIYFTDSWDRGMGWTIRYSCVSERDRWTSRGMSHDPMGPWDGMDTYICRGTGGHPVVSPMGLWDGMDNPM